MALFTPGGAEPDGPLPVLLDPYGGPHFAVVQKVLTLQLESQWFADQGFAVLVIDGRGTPGRGPGWDREVYRNLADPVLEDQVEGLHAAAERYPFLDLERVAIRGWSFGGFLAAMAVLRRPDVFHAAVSGAPVTDGELYDTHYTERYLGMPDTDVEAYARYRLLDDAPNLRRPLLLIHGLADDNVYVANTLRLSKALMEAGRFHSVIPLSGITHAPSQPEVAENLLLLQVRFLRDALGLAPIRPEAAATLGRIANGGPLSVPIIVQKYGGTSVGTTERIQAVADRVVRAKEDGFDVLVAVSAMGDTTDDLLAMAKQIAPVPNPRELDMLLTAGERIAMSLLAIAINARGCKAASYTGSQAGIITDTQHGAARIVEIRPKRILESLGEGNVVIVAGFQGLSTNYDITTLGRGGSDTTAVAMAAATGAEVCEIYTDVQGVFTADPRIEPSARKVETISYEEMLELSAAGAKVLSSRSVEYARRHGVKLHVRSSFDDVPGTWVQEADEAQMEGVLISGVALDNDEAKVTLDRVPDRPGVAATVFRAIAGEGISVDMIVQNVSHEGATDLSFTAPLADIPRLQSVMERVVKEIDATRFSIDDQISKVSLVGAGMKAHPGVAADLFDALAAEGINIEMISTSPIRISCVIRKADAERAVRTIHARFELDRDGVRPDAAT